MRGRRVISIVLLFSAILMVSAVFASGLVTVPVSLNNVLSPTEGAGTLSTASVFMNPAAIIKDYINNPGYQIGNKFTVDVDIADVTDLFTWQVNVTWNPAVLNFSKVESYGTFLRATTSPNGTSGWINQDPTKNVTIASVNYTRGYASIAETILDNRTVAPGVSGSGGLVTIEFEVLDYGYCDITIGLAGTLKTTLLNSAKPPVEITPFTTADGWFNNKITGDSDGSGRVNVVDIAAVNGHWWPTPTYPQEYRSFDTNDDGVINVVDIAVVNANWGRSTS
jgi:hypothetical protein